VADFTTVSAKLAMLVARCYQSFSGSVTRGKPKMRQKRRLTPLGRGGTYRH
jgi:hypothetical protein